ncbi:hypothetical protein DI273_00180 [Streptomyces violascens]|nr:hypothetical protein DI273_00180 [Streptomyces violascens]
MGRSAHPRGFPPVLAGPRCAGAARRRARCRGTAPPGSPRRGRRRAGGCRGAADLRRLAMRNCCCGIRTRLPNLRGHQSPGSASS